MMKKITFIISAVLLISTGCSENQSQYNYASSKGPSGTAVDSQDSFKSISPQSAKKIIDSRSDVLVIDVRTPQELQNGRIEGSNLLPFWSMMRGEHKLPKDKAIILVCAVGGRSYSVGLVLAGSGYREVYNLSGGIESWKRAGLPVKY